MEVLKRTLINRFKEEVDLQRINAVHLSALSDFYVYLFDLHEELIENPLTQKDLITENDRLTMQTEKLIDEANQATKDWPVTYVTNIGEWRKIYVTGNLKGYHI